MNFFVTGVLPFALLVKLSAFVDSLVTFARLSFLALLTVTHSSHVHGRYSTVILCQGTAGLVDVAGLQVVPDELLGLLVVRANLSSSGSHGVLHWAGSVLHQHCHSHGLRHGLLGLHLIAPHQHFPYVSIVSSSSDSFSSSSQVL